MNLRSAIASLAAGSCASMVHALLMAIKHRAAILPGFEPYEDLQRLLASITDYSLSPPWSWLLPYVNGALILGFAFGKLFALLPARTSIGKGAAFGFAAWLLMGVGFLPLAGRGPFGVRLGYGATPAALMLAMLMVYSIAMSLLYARLTRSASREAR